MESENFDRSMRTSCRRVPFEPFTVELESGTRFQVDHPETLAVNGGAAVFVAQAGTPSLFDHRSISQLIGTSDPRSAQAA